MSSSSQIILKGFLLIVGLSWLFFEISANVPALGEVAKFETDYFPLKIKFLAKRKREFTTKFAILPNGCYATFFNIRKRKFRLLCFFFLVQYIPFAIQYYHKLAV